MIRIILIALVIATAGCELVVIGNKKPPKKVIDVTQETSTGAAMVFMTELQQNNIAGAAQLLADVDKRYSAELQAEQYYNLARFTRIFQDRNISRVITDTLSEEVHNVKLEYDYVKEMSFSMRVLDSLWYVVDYKLIR